MADRRWAETRARDRRLVGACLKGDEDAWTALWVAYGPLVKAIARRAGCDDEDSSEVLQRTALVALQSLERLREPDKLAGWLAGVARFQSLEIRRGQRRTEEIFESTAVVDARVDDDLERDQELATLRLAMLRLEDRCRTLVTRLDLKEPSDSYRVVAEDLGLSPTSIGPIRRRCLERLRKLLIELSRSGD
jgi:RNA polymerase sigma factor (sigma-70 family)